MGTKKELHVVSTIEVNMTYIPAISASVQNKNAHTKGAHYKSILKSALKGRWLHILINSQHFEHTNLQRNLGNMLTKNQLFL